MLRLILGRAGSGKTSTVLRRICDSGNQRPQVLIVPEQQSHETERALCRIGGNQVSRYAEVLSFSRLANRVFQAAGGLGDRELDDGGRILLMYRAVKSLTGQLTVYAKPSRRPAFLQSLLETSEELKSCCAAPELLITAGQDIGGVEGNKLRDLGLICGAYDALTAQIALDPRDRLTRVAEKLSEYPWAKGKDLWLDGFTDFTPQQGEVLKKLMVQAQNINITLTCDHLEESQDREGIFAPAWKTAKTLLRWAEMSRVKCEVEYLATIEGGKVNGLQELEKTLFSDSEHCYIADSAVELFQASGIRSEVEWVAARILQLVREEGVRFRDIGVVARDYNIYQNFVESLFPRYNVPVFSSAMSSILDKPVMALVVAALEAVSGGYTYEDMFRYLKTGLTDLSEEECDILENYVLKWEIKGSRWTQEKMWPWHPRGYGAPWEESDRDLLEHLDHIRKKVIIPLEHLRKNKEKTSDCQAKALYEFLKEIGLPEQLKKRVERLRKNGEFALADEYRQLWEILCGALEQCASLLCDIPMELEEFSRLFQLVLSQYDVGTIPVSLDRVTAGETTRQTSHRVKVLFLLGADENSIPKVSEAPGLLSDEDRSLLSSYGLELNQSQEELLYREMTTVYLTCTQPSRKLVISWPLHGPGGEEQGPSFLVKKIQQLFLDVAVVQEEDLNGVFRLEAPLPALEQAGLSPAVCVALKKLPEYRERIKRLEYASQWGRGSLSAHAVERLYGRKVPMSASRMDKYKSCHFSYFMRYGLKAEPRKVAGFKAPEYGTFVHYILEHVLQDELFQQTEIPGMTLGLTEKRKERLHQLTKNAVDCYVAEELGGLEGQNERFQYLFRRLLRGVQSVVDNVAEELLSSCFKPISFELGFGKGEALPPVELSAGGVTISMTGFVDRVDGWVHDGRLYLRVVDYKTGRKSFDLTEIWNGLGLQMLLYLFTLEEKGASIYGLPVEGAGVLYLPARDAVIRGSRTMNCEAWQQQMDKELRRSGLVLDDHEVLNAMEMPSSAGYRFLPLKISRGTGMTTGEALVTAERLGKIGQHIRKTLEEICQEIACGNISADPFWRGPDKNACRFCDYSSACHFEPGRGGDCKRWLANVDAQTFWTNLEAEEN